MYRWFEINGKDSDVVISSRVRLARNLTDYNFSLKLTNEDAAKMTNDTMKKLVNIKELDDYISYDFKRLNHLKREAMTERHAISQYLYNQKIAAGLISPQEDISIMVNEEDHIRIQVFCSGSDMVSAYKKADMIDDSISNVVEYAYNSQYGYLTTCPSNVGTGMRASYMLHLPALAGNNKLNGLASEIGRFGLIIKGVYGDDIKGMGDIYQISNQVTLGHTEIEIIENLTNIVYQIVQQERASRRQYISRRRAIAEDTAYRSYGVLKYSRKMSFMDSMVLLSELRMGLSEGLLKISPALEEKHFSVYQIMIGVQPANLQLMCQRELSQDDIEIERAKFIRDNLPEIV